MAVWNCSPLLLLQEDNFLFSRLLLCGGSFFFPSIFNQSVRKSFFESCLSLSWFPVSSCAGRCLEVKSLFLYNVEERSVLVVLLLSFSRTLNGKCAASLHYCDCEFCVVDLQPPCYHCSLLLNSRGGSFRLPLLEQTLGDLLLCRGHGRHGGRLVGEEFNFSSQVIWTNDLDE